MKTMLAIWLLAFSALAADVQLSWDANKEDNLFCYKLHWGSNSGSYSNTVYTTNITTIASNLPAGAIFFAVQAINSEGQESDYSDELIITNGVASRLIVVLSSGTIAQSSAITGIFKAKGWGLCSRVEGVWLVSDVPSWITSRFIAEEISRHPLIGGKVKLVMKIPEVDGLTYWGNAPKDVWTWMAASWGKSG